MGISAVSEQNFSVIDTTSSERPVWDVLRENVSDPMNWLYIVPTIGALALCVFLAPTAAPIGMAVGVATCVGSAVVLIALKVANLMTPDENSEYEQILREYPSLGTLVAPVIEEGIFRGLIQPLATRAILFLIPAAGAALLGPSLSIAVTVSVVATAVLFGITHLFNSHKNSHIQAIVTTFSGIAFGLIAAQFGLPAAIAAHMINNTILITINRLFKDKTAQSTQTSST